MNGIFAVIIFTLCMFMLVVSENGKVSILHRNKRYVAFPEGSTFIATICATYNTITPSGLFLQGVNWGVAYDLPNVTTLSAYFHENKKVLNRRQKRDLYNRIETVIDRYYWARYEGRLKINAYMLVEQKQAKLGYDGRSCIYRALCEASRKFAMRSQNESSLSRLLLRLFFTFPLGHLAYDEPDDHRLYHWAARQGFEMKMQNCEDIFPECPISLIDLALGIY